MVDVGEPSERRTRALDADERVTVYIKRFEYVDRARTRAVRRAFDR